MVSPGTVVSHYRLVRRLGAGGMGEVYLAQDTSLDRPVAIKFLIAPDDEHGRQRLLREARAVAALDHPHICGVYEVGTDPVGGDFVVMQYIEGESLAARLKRGRLLPEEAVSIAGHIAEALQAAHRRGIIHRDLKPQNIIIMPSGSAKLLDFGLARQLETSDVAAEAQTVSPLTQAHAVIGTAGYMAPEQLRGRRADVRTDVFALGCVLYECLTGRRAFTGSTAADINGQALHVDAPLVSSIVPELGPAYDALCARLMQKSAADRLQSAEEVLGAIKGLSGGSQSSAVTSGATPVSAPWSAGRRVSISVAMLIAIGLVGLLAWQWNRRRDLPPAPEDARVWYQKGIDALREGSFAGAKASLQEAVRRYPQYVQAYARLAEAQSELDDNAGAKDALVQVGVLVPDRTRLPLDDQLRLEAAQSSVLRKHDDAIRAYRELAAGQSSDAGTWVDLGRAEEAAERLKDAREHYEKALALDSQSAVAHLRLGLAQSRVGQAAAAFAALDEAIRLYRIGANSEGEAEALLRKGAAQSTIGQYAAARSTLEQAAVVAADPLYISQRLRARFELARAASFEGKFNEAEAAAREAVAQAFEAGLQSIAANGLIELANTLIQRGNYADALPLLTRAEEIAKTSGAARTEMRARLQRAALRLADRSGDSAAPSPREAMAARSRDALNLCQGPLAFFTDHHYIRLEVTARNIMARAHENLEDYEEANRLATDALRIEESIGDDALVATSLENIALQLPKFGRHPEALAYRERIEQIHRKQHDQSSLAHDLPSHAQLLIELGRGRDAEALLAEVDDGIAKRAEAFMGQARRVTYLRALRAATEGHLEAIAPLVASLALPPPAKPDALVQWGRILGEYARARLRTAVTPAATIVGWLGEAGSPLQQRELSYWVALALLERREYALAYEVASQAGSAQAAQANPELMWRLAAIASRAAQRLPSAPIGASIGGLGATDRERLKTLWGDHAGAYFSRADLMTLR
jgi:tetratricopeptide (TPR) repeat protein